MNRDQMLSRLRSRSAPFDLVIIGGGATGLGTAVDAASRGYSVALLEQADFAKGTSSRSTKLVHGGVRYLQQGNVALVMEALRERGLLLRNAPHLVRDVAFIVPSYEWWESPFYGIGLKVYDLLAGRYGFGKSQHVSAAAVRREIPSIRTQGLLGGTRYYDGQFDDARLAVNLATTAAEHGATLVNYTAVTGLVKDGDGAVQGVTARDQETGEELEVSGKVVVNATGPFADTVRRMDHPDAAPIIEPSQGVHIVLDRSFLPGSTAIMVPHTDDGRVMFAIPWHGVAVVGTTDTPVREVSLEPRALDHEVESILETANDYLSHPAGASDIRSVFTGIRPLVRTDGDRRTADLSREHVILIDPVSGLLTVAGGKWTTYRKMAADVLDRAILLGDLDPRPCVTQDLRVHGAGGDAAGAGAVPGGAGAVPERLRVYGSDARAILRLEAESEDARTPLHPSLAITAAEVRWACRSEMARTVDDVLARRTRALLLDARAALETAPRVAAILGEELGRDEEWVRVQVDAFREIAAAYVYVSGDRGRA